MGEALTDHSADIFVPPTFFCDAIFNQKELTFQTRRANILTPCTVSLGWRKIERYIIEFRLSSSLKQNAPRRVYKSRLPGSPGPIFVPTGESRCKYSRLGRSFDRSRRPLRRPTIFSFLLFLPPPLDNISFSRTRPHRGKISVSVVVVIDSVTVWREVNGNRPNKFRGKKEERQRERAVWTNDLGRTIVWISEMAICERE